MESLEEISEQNNEESKAETQERQLPVGIGGMKLKEKRETLPAVKVDNEVSWVNNKMNLPFDFKVGEPSNLGMFLTPEPKEGENTYGLEISGSHTRSGILGRVIFSDKEGRLYRDIDLKGMGFIRSRVGVNMVGPITGSYGEIPDEMSRFGFFKGTTGIANQELIRRDVDFSEKFIKAGIRTHRVIAVLDLKELINNNGNKITIAEAKEAGMLSREDEPVIEVRAFGVRSRIHDINVEFHNGTGREGVALSLLQDAKKMVAQELNINPGQFSYDDYIKWLIKTTATNIARMHYNKWVNGYLTEHNITLDARIVDLDSVEKLNRKADVGGEEFGKKNFKNDLSKAKDSLSDLLCNIIEYRLFFSDFLPDKNTYLQFGEDSLEKIFSEFFEKTYEDELERLKLEKTPRIK